eukprot:scaffold7481_cov420-Pinguiococcus_pyrenoidosus.AAC.1
MRAPRRQIEGGGSAFSAKGSEVGSFMELTNWRRKRLHFATINQSRAIKSAAVLGIPNNSSNQKHTYYAPASIRVFDMQIFTDGLFRIFSASNTRKTRQSGFAPPSEPLLPTPEEATELPRKL